MIGGAGNPWGALVPATGPNIGPGSLSKHGQWTHSAKLSPEEKLIKLEIISFPKTNDSLKAFDPLQHNKKSNIRETKHLSTDADSSTHTTEGWTKNTQKNNFFFYGKNHPKRKNSKTSRNTPKLAICPLTRGL